MVLELRRNVGLNKDNQQTLCSVTASLSVTVYKSVFPAAVIPLLLLAG